MSPNNSTYDPNCPFRDWYLDIGAKADFIIFHVFTPIYFAVALVGHILCLTAFCIQAKKEQAYVYQIFSTVCELWLVISETFFVVMSAWWAKLTVASPPSPLWFRRCYGCVWTAAHVTAPFVNCLITM